jgi:hypothetical protein
LAGSYYIYALKDPTLNPATAFYIGKGTGTRAWDHLLNVDETAKGQTIEKIKQSNQDVIVTILADELAEHQALKLEAELISAFGTISTGGILTNLVVPSVDIKRLRRDLVVPTGVREKSEIGLKLIKDSAVELAKANVSGITNADTAKALGLQSNYNGGAKDYLSYSILGLLMDEGRLIRDDSVKKGRHICVAK